MRTLSVLLLCVLFLYSRILCKNHINWNKKPFTHISKSLLPLLPKLRVFMHLNMIAIFISKVQLLAFLPQQPVLVFMISVLFDKDLEEYFASIIFSLEYFTGHFAFMYSYVLFEYLLSLILNNKSSVYTALLKLSIDDIHIEVLVLTCPEIFIRSNRCVINAVDHCLWQEKCNE